MARRKRVFISYSHEDTDWLQRIQGQLAVLEREGLIDVFVDTQIGAGQDWFARLHAEMLKARVALLLVSAPFLTSAFIGEEEVPRLFDNHAERGMTIYPLLVRPCPWKRVKWLSLLQLRPPNGKPVSSLRGANREQALATVADEIATLVALKSRAKHRRVAKHAEPARPTPKGRRP